MNALRLPKNKLLLALALVLVLGLVIPLAGRGGVAAARTALALAAVAGLAWWLYRARRPAAFKLAPALEVLSRVGLSPRCAMALVEVEGRKYLVVHGDGFASIRPSLPRHRRVRSSQLVGTGGAQ